MSHGDYTYDAVTGVERYRGVKVIDIGEQVSLITQACGISDANPKMQIAHQDNYNKYEIDGEIKYGMNAQWVKDRPAGYCRVYNLKHGKRYSVSPHLSYNCAECLGADLIYNRSVYPGIDVELTIMKHESNIDATRAIDISKLEKVQFKFNKGVCELIFSRHTSCRVVDFTFLVRPGQSPLLRVNGCRSRGGEMFYGTHTATMLGIPICESILRGETCRSLSSNEPIRDFSINSVPRGYPAWTELQREYIRADTKRPVGKIWVHRKCKRCTDAEPIKPDPVRETTMDNTILDSRDQMIRTLMEENRLLREQMKEILIRIDHK